MLARIRKATEEKDEGFTLIELLVVIIIIGILAAIAIPTFLSQRKKGVDAGIKSDMKNAATAEATAQTDSPGNIYYAFGPVTGPNTAQVGPNGTTDNPVTPTTNDVITATTKSLNGQPNAAFCIMGYNPASSHNQNAPWVYDSALGGMQPATTTTCSAGT